MTSHPSVETAPHPTPRRVARRRVSAAVTALALVASAAACGSDDGTSPATGTSVVDAASPSGRLDTPAQRAYEARTLAVLDTDVMRAAIARVEDRYRADPQGARPAGAATVERAAHAIGVAAVGYVLADTPADPSLVWTTAAEHSFGGATMPSSGYGIENPDNVYRGATVAGSERYEIHGVLDENRPTELHFEFRDAIPGTRDLTAEGGGLLGSVSDAQLVTEPDGSFTVTVDSTPADGRPNHVTLPADARSVLVVRDLLLDWTHELPAPLEIRRVAGTLDEPALSTDDVADRASALLDTISPYWLGYFGTFYYTAPTNEIRTPRARPGGRGAATGGTFDLRDDQALVVTVDRLDARALDVQVSDPWGAAYEYRDRTSSLNNDQAVAGPDGTYTFVISSHDPGVANWLDPSGHEAGMIAVRWQSLPDTAPDLSGAVRSRVVPLADVRDALPADHPTVNGEQRTTERDQRSAAYESRLTA